MEHYYVMLIRIAYEGDVFVGFFDSREKAIEELPNVINKWHVSGSCEQVVLVKIEKNKFRDQKTAFDNKDEEVIHPKKEKKVDDDKGLGWTETFSLPDDWRR